MRLRGQVPFRLFLCVLSMLAALAGARPVMAQQVIIKTSPVSVSIASDGQSVTTIAVPDFDRSLGRPLNFFAFIVGNIVFHGTAQNFSSVPPSTPLFTVALSGTLDLSPLSPGGIASGSIPYPIACVFVSATVTCDPFSLQGDFDVPLFAIPFGVVSGDLPEPLGGSATLALSSAIVPGSGTFHGTITIDGELNILYTYAPGATVSFVTGAVSATLHGQPVVIAQGTSIGKGLLITTGADGQVSGGCPDGTAIAIKPNSRVLFDDFPCGVFSAGLTDLTAGSASLVRGGEVVQLGLRTPVNLVNLREAGTDVTVSYVQSGPSGTATTTVAAGSADAVNATTGATTTLKPGDVGEDPGALPTVFASVLPSSRSVRIGSAATAFATVHNAGPIPATACDLSPGPSLPATFWFQATNPATNGPAGTRGDPVAIAPNESKTFIFGFEPGAVIAPGDVAIRFGCSSGVQAAEIVGVNTLFLSASPDPVPDVVALTATPTGENQIGGVVTMIGNTGSSFFGVATVNVGVAGTIVVSADATPAGLPIALSLCRTDPVTGACMEAPKAAVTVAVDADARLTFAVFVSALGTEIALDPALNRIFLRFRDVAGTTRGSTSVAVRTFVPIGSPGGPLRQSAGTVPPATGHPARAERD